MEAGGGEYQCELPGVSGGNSSSRALTMASVKSAAGSALNDAMASSILGFALAQRLAVVPLHKINASVDPSMLIDLALAINRRSTSRIAGVSATNVNSNNSYSPSALRDLSRIS